MLLSLSIHGVLVGENKNKYAFFLILPWAGGGGGRGRVVLFFSKEHSVSFRTVLSKGPKLKLFTPCLSAFYIHILLVKEEEVATTF